MKIARACRFPAADQPGDFVRTQQARCPVMRALGVCMESTGNRRLAKHRNWKRTEQAEHRRTVARPRPNRTPVQPTWTRRRLHGGGADLLGMAYLMEGMGQGPVFELRL